MHNFSYILRVFGYSLFLGVFVLTVACDDSKTQTHSMLSDQGSEQNDDLGQSDAELEPEDLTVADMGELDQEQPLEDMSWVFDLAVVEEEYNQRAPSVDRLYSGYAERALGFPIGIGTVGFFPAPGGFKNPFNPSGTHTLHSHLSARALLLRQGEQSLVLLRVDLAAMWQDFVVDVKRVLRSKGRGDLAEGLVIGATHTHASGGKIISHPILRLLAGQFSPALYHRVLNNLVEVVLEADQNAAPAQVGYKTIQVDSLHSDRRCENGDIIDHSMGLLKVTDDSGELKAVLVNYAMHATVIGNREFILSNDATGALERGVEQRLNQYAPVLYFQSWAGDMSPSIPQHQMTQEGNEPNRHYKDLDAIGKEAAERIIPELESIEMSSTYELKVKTIRFPMNNQLVNPDGSFDRYPFGGAYCYPTDNSNCPDEAGNQRIYTSDDLNCLIAVPEADSITWGHITAIQLGELGMVSLPGEPLTSIGVELRDRILDLTGLEKVWVLGYTQGYLGYLLHYDDYFLGGYEGAGGIWGPGLGQFLVDRGVEIMKHLIDSSSPLSFLPIPLPAQAEVPLEEISYEEALGEPTWLEIPNLHEEGYWTGEWRGGDPAIDTPYVTLQKAQLAENGEELWLPFTHFSGVAWDSHSGELELSLRVEPSYTEQAEQIGRSFYWRVRMPQYFSVEPSLGALNGRFRWYVEGQSPTAYQITSAPFEIE